MGIPRFYKIITERYPLLVELAQEKEKGAGYDNLYIDMNAIIHMNTHNNEKEEKEKNMEEMCRNICEYVDRVVHLVGPRDLVFISVDGVVCRTKMNQQRSRRFASTKEARPQFFDPNCISPGTEFMQYQQDNILQYIQRKKETDELWKNLTIVYSGHRIPGEGEHKIMSYIRDTDKESRGKRHCIHGMDADLILLTLLTSMPHFSILREETNIKNERTERFLLFHSHILREYICLEMKIHIRDAAVPSIINDIVLVMNLFGNDFVPGAFNIVESFDRVLEIYGRQYRKHRSHLHQKGVINWRVYLEFLKELTEYEIVFHLEKSMGAAPEPKKDKQKGRQGTAEELLEDSYKDFLALATSVLQAATKRNKLPFITKEVLAAARAPNTRNANSIVANILGSATQGAEHREKGDEKGEKKQLLKQLQSAPLLESLPLLQQAQTVWQAMREQKYHEKQIEKESVEIYLLAQQWICFYYFRSCPSWRWYYNSHYSVYVTDAYEKLRDVIAALPETATNRDICFGISGDNLDKNPFSADRPISPFVQLLGILPPQSKSLLPAALQPVFSELKEYYPMDFKTDKNGKKAAWEALCLIPFVDIDRIEQAVRSKIDKVSSWEAERNAKDTIYIWQKESEKMETLDAHHKNMPQLHKLVLGTSKIKLPQYTPSLFSKSLNGRMSKVVMRSFFAGERNRLVVTLKTCSELAILLRDWEQNPSSTRLEWVFDGRHTYVGFPYLTPCRIKTIKYKNLVVTLNKKNELERAAVSKEQQKSIKDVTKTLFFKKGIYVIYKDDYAVCEVDGQEEVYPLEVLVYNKYIALARSSAPE